MCTSYWQIIKSDKMGLSQAIYNGIFKRTSTFVVAIAFASFGFERCKYYPLLNAHIGL